MSLAFEKLSKRRLQGVHPDLTDVVHKAIESLDVPVLVVEGKRTKARQRQLVRKGASQTMNSRHLTGHAVDLVAVDGRKLLWGRPYYQSISAAMKSAAEELNVDIDWGGDWRSFKDTPHYQLNWKAYPKDDKSWQDRVKPEVKPCQVLAKTSRKYKTAGLGKHASAGFAASAISYASLQNVTATQSYLDAISSLLRTYGIVVAIAAGVAGWLIFELLQRWQEEDYEEGRYETKEDMNEGSGEWL